MKLVVSYTVADDYDREERLVSTKEFLDSDDEHEEFEAAQSVVDKYEDLGLTIDQGGDAEAYEFNLPDGFLKAEEPEGRKQAEALLRDLEVAFADFEVTS